MKYALIATLRNELNMKLDLLAGSGDGWYRLRLWRTKDDGASASIKEMGITQLELEIALTKIVAEKSASRTLESP